MSESKKTKEEMSKEINELLFETEDKVDFTGMTKVDLAVFKEKLDSDEAIKVGWNLLKSRGVGDGKGLEIAKNILQGQGGLDNLKKFINKEND